MVGEDKLKHIVVSAAMSAVLATVLPWWVAALVTLSVGVAKEVLDKVRGKGCEWLDIVADAIGIIIGII